MILLDARLLKRRTIFIVVINRSRTYESTTHLVWGSRTERCRDLRAVVASRWDTDTLQRTDANSWSRRPCRCEYTHSRTVAAPAHRHTPVRDSRCGRRTRLRAGWGGGGGRGTGRVVVSRMLRMDWRRFAHRKCCSTLADVCTLQRNTTSRGQLIT